MVQKSAKKTVSVHIIVDCEYVRNIFTCQCRKYYNKPICLLHCNAHAWHCVDFDLQVALMEALCRMTSRAQRRELADQWFSMEFVATAFTKIQDLEFETVSDHVLIKLFVFNIYKEGFG